MQRLDASEQICIEPNGIGVGSQFWRDFGLDVIDNLAGVCRRLVVKDIQHAPKGASGTFESDDRVLEGGLTRLENCLNLGQLLGASRIEGRQVVFVADSAEIRQLIGECADRCERVSACEFFGVESHSASLKQSRDHRLVPT